MGGDETWRRAHIKDVHVERRIVGTPLYSVRVTAEAAISEVPAAAYADVATALLVLCVEQARLQGEDVTPAIRRLGEALHSLGIPADDLQAWSPR